MTESGRLSESPHGPADSTTTSIKMLQKAYDHAHQQVAPYAVLGSVEDYKHDPNNDDGKSCLICGHVSHGYHFGILACRACAAFFRRTVAEKKVYKCRQNCNCAIRKDMRNTCRYCRFRKCVSLGMNQNDVQMNREPLGKRMENEMQPQTVECCVKPTSCCENGSISSVSPNSQINGATTINGGTSSVISNLSTESVAGEQMDLGASTFLNANQLSNPAVSLFSSPFQSTLSNGTSLLTPPISLSSNLSPMPFALNEALMNSVAASAASTNFVSASTSIPNQLMNSVSAGLVSSQQFNAAQIATTTANQLAAVNAAALAAQQLQAQQHIAAMTLIQNATIAELAAQQERAEREQQERQQATSFSLISTPSIPTVSSTDVANPIANVSSAQSTEIATPTTSASSPSIALIPYAPLPGPSLLQRMHEGYANYQSSQKSLYTVMYPNNVFSTESYRLVKRSEHIKMERGCLSLMYSMVNDWFQPFDTLAHDLKVHVLRAFSAIFSHLDQCFKTMQAFGEMNDSRFVLHYGQLIDSNKLEYFFQEDKDPSASANICKEINARCLHLTNKMRKLAVREIEVAAMAGIMLWNEVAIACNYDNTDKIRDRIYSELHSNIIITYGVNETGARMGSLLCLLHDLNMIAKQISESVIIGKIFNPHVIELFDEN
ncbi:Nuclear receptor domain-containing protein [Aphelenchoides besseyi]|nr:Nuclear receptor domain-containing protein [Aphelenchoides besseyi]KAI6211288.1 Nuclear receptor domain-containing protein [Aphelenchoides besseyi]